MPSQRSGLFLNLKFDIEYDDIDKVYYTTEQHQIEFDFDEVIENTTPFTFESYLDDIVQTVGWY